MEDYWELTMQGTMEGIVGAPNEGHSWSGTKNGTQDTVLVQHSPQGD